MQASPPAARIAATDIACRRGDRVLFRGVSFTLEQGKALHIAGPNGVGKSSLLRIMAGLMRPFFGQVETSGGIALLDERPALDHQLPLGKALDFWAGLDGDSAAAAMSALRLDDLADVPVRYLSTGQRKRASIARLTAQPAAIWLLDEPLNGLDRQSIGVAEKLCSDFLAGGGIILAASHQPIALDSTQRLDLAEFAL